MRLCTTCHTLQPIDLFCKSSKTKDGIGNRCRPCRIAAIKRHYDAKPKLPPIRPEKQNIPDIFTSKSYTKTSLVRHFY